MTDSKFFSLYLPALKAALDNDEVNSGFAVLGPDYYIIKKYIYDIEEFIESNQNYTIFFDNVGYYFDAKSHYYSNVRGIEIKTFRSYLVHEMEKYSSIFNISLGGSFFPSS